jgi:hypothetical protein
MVLSTIIKITQKPGLSQKLCPNADGISGLFTGKITDRTIRNY